ncbi:polyprenyl synthetase family protein [Angustibacter sp. McL0619]|uniref:polyprenyl synthetase family protein n=1 Tax=Angustibacter sp. McL0619 TaxID=3415676 RepID=UPI003CE80AC4
MPHPLDVEDLRSRVHKVIDDHLSKQAAQLEPLGADLVPLLEAIAELVSGGKRLRAAFCYWGWRAAGGADCAQIVHAAAAFEIFQAAALLHDDVMDASDTRRGLPAAHRRMAALHRENGWDGDADRFGTAAAILAGDLCLSWCDDLFSHSGLTVEAVARARPTFDLMRTQLMGGQYLDVMEQVLPRRSGGGTTARARRVIRYKSAKYSVEHPLLVGGLLAGASPAQLAAYSAYGLPLGEAFQLRDDVLGVFGDPAQTGKPAGDDLREGKRTVLVAEVVSRGTAAQIEVLDSLLGRAELNPAGVDALREVMVDSGALAAVEQLIDELAAQSADALEGSGAQQPGLTVLSELIAAATARTS